MSQNQKQEEKNRVVGGMLYLVSTPIGNLSDLSARALKVLSEADFIACEDTRNTVRLLTHFGISRPLVSYHEHNKRERGEQIAARLLAGESCALVSDAGTPAISDPGEELVVLCAERGVPVTAIPGCCASITALTLSGLPTARFCFEGFLPMDKKERRARLEVISRETRTMLLHEAPHKLRATLADLLQVLGGERRISLCRELTKRNEEILRTTLAQAVAYYESEEPRGEYVLVLEGADPSSIQQQSPEAALCLLPPEEHVAYYEREGLRRMDAIKAAAKDRGMAKNELYRILCGESS